MGGAKRNPSNVTIPRTYTTMTDYRRNFLPGGSYFFTVVIATSLAEKMSALMTSDYLDARAKRGSARAFHRVLKKVKDRAPITGDER